MWYICFYFAKCCVIVPTFLSTTSSFPSLCLRRVIESQFSEDDSINTNLILAQTCAKFKCAEAERLVSAFDLDLPGTLKAHFLFQAALEARV